MAARLPAHLQVVRALLRHLNYRAGAGAAVPAEPFDPALLKRAEEALRQMPMPDAGARAYLEKHIPRLARTLALVPPPPTSLEQSTGRVLELGCYMQMTALLQRLCGYREVRGGYYGSLGRTDQKTQAFPDGVFTCEVDHFDAERDVFPYPDAHFDLVIAAEVIEHLVYDPLHMLLEARRALIEGGYLLISTPNVGSIASVAKTLDGKDNPQIYFLYNRPRPGGELEMGHFREYTFHELGETVKSAGFEIVKHFTTFLPDFASHLPLLKLLEEHGYDTENRGEQTWCLARKRASLPVDRFPWFLYEP
jgi:SAM-dependent methyltransferase